MKSMQLTDLRAELARRQLAGFLVPRADEHLGEYVPANAERLAWISGFTGSAGLGIVLADQACLFVDGRYVLQAEAQTDPAAWLRRHVTEQPPAVWLAETAPGAAIGYDPWLHAEADVARYAEAGVALVACDDNPIDAVWRDRPQPPPDPAVRHAIELSGKTAADKRAEVAARLQASRLEASVVSDPACLAWLLNVRGSDVPFTPFVLGFGVMRADATFDVYADPSKFAGLGNWLDAEVRIHPRAELPAALTALSGRRVGVDPASQPSAFGRILKAAGAEVVAGLDPVMLPKARKNAVEQDGARSAQARDAVALCRFLHWISGQPPGAETELSAAARLLAFRAEQPDFRGESFPAISASGPHAAIMHYRVEVASDRPVGPDAVYLIDSGAQFGSATTDVTRTLWIGPAAPPPELRERVTQVLRGHIAMATLVFPQGVCGPHLDSFARHALWQVGLDFDHGTGHGVGSFLSVHEGPVSFSRPARMVPLEAGMQLSNEPGFYAPGEYGIRLENLLLVQPAPDLSTQRPFLRFETITRAPFDRTLIDAALLRPDERAWLDGYHARVLAEVGPRLPGNAREWLERACAPL